MYYLKKGEIRMRFPSVKRAIRICLLALFITCLGLLVGTGQAAASSSHGNPWCHQQSDGYWTCQGADWNQKYGDHHDNNDHNNCDPYNGYCSHVGDSSNGCDQWDPNTGLCTHWELDLSASPHSDYYYHSSDYYYRYYRDNHSHCGC
jgi:hypothetical protein